MTEAAGFAPPELSEDGFLGGRLRLLQPRRGYRAGVDPVFLAAAVPARTGERVLELGCGAGAALLCLGRRVPGLALAGLEKQPAYAALARANGERNGIALDVVEGDLRTMPARLRAQSFDHVICNPPFYDRARGTAAADAGREAALGGTLPLADWVAAGLRRLRPGGRFTAIVAAERLPEMLAAFPPAARGIRVHPLAPRAGRAAHRAILVARKGARAPFHLAPAQVLHAGPAHLKDGEDYAPEARAVLRDGAAWPWTEG